MSSSCAGALDSKAARKRIVAALKRNPMDPSLLVLRDSLDRDPVELLGPTNHAYTVRAGDTMTGLAERFLGNRLKAYQLARYNAVLGASVLVVDNGAVRYCCVRAAGAWRFVEALPPFGGDGPTVAR